MTVDRSVFFECSSLKARHFNYKKKVGVFGAGIFRTFFYRSDCFIRVDSGRKKACRSCRCRRSARST